MFTKQLDAIACFIEGRPSRSGYLASDGVSLRYRQTLIAFHPEPARFRDRTSLRVVVVKANAGVSPTVIGDVRRLGKVAKVEVRIR